MCEIQKGTINPGGAITFEKSLVERVARLEDEAGHLANTVRARGEKTEELEARLAAAEQRLSAISLDGRSGEKLSGDT